MSGDPRLGYRLGVISRVSGRLIGVSEAGAEMEPAPGVVLLVLLPAYLSDDLRRKAGEPITLHTLCYLEGVSQGASYLPRLIGFEHPADRTFFELLTTVKGLGNRKVLRALTRPPASVALAIKAGDLESLQTLPEIGKRTAETIVHELRRKVEPFLLARSGELDAALESDGLGGAEASEWDHPLGPAAGEAVSALMTLGENRRDAQRLVSAAIKECGESAPSDQILAAAFGKRGG